jgi:hypothetical protein
MGKSKQELKALKNKIFDWYIITNDQEFKSFFGIEAEITNPECDMTLASYEQWVLDYIKTKQA